MGSPAQAAWPVSHHVEYTSGEHGLQWKFTPERYSHIGSMLEAGFVASIHVRLSDGSLVIVKRKGGGEG